MKSYKLRKLKIELTDRCLLRCVHCSSNAGQTGANEIPVDTCLRVINDAAAMKVTNVTFSGGEPLLYPFLLPVVQLSAEHGMCVSVYTTGIAPSFENKVQDLQKAGVGCLVFSLYSSAMSGHEAITQTEGSFEKTCRAIKHTAGSGLAVKLHFVPLRSNYCELDAVVDLGAKLGVTQVSVLRFVPHGRGRDLCREALNTQQNYQLRKMIIRHRDVEACSKIRTGSPYNFLLLTDQPKCHAAIDRMTIMSDLRIVPCDAFKQVLAEDIAGDNSFSSLTCSSLRDCWEKSAYLRTIRDHLPPQLPDECLLCSAVKECRSGCLAQKFLANGSLGKNRDPDCLMKTISPQRKEVRTMAKDAAGMRGYRSRNENGHLRDTRDDKHVGTLEKQYDREFGVRKDMHIGTLLKETEKASVNDLVHSNIGKK